MNDRSLVERLEAATRELGVIYEDLAEATYHAVESEQLKQVAIGAGIDHTIVPTEIIKQLGQQLQRQRDVNRELHRQVNALQRMVDRLGTYAD